MVGKLIKIENEYYLTTEAKVEKGDYGVIFAHGISGFGRGWHTFHHEGTPGHKLDAICAGTRKITHSTAPIDGDEAGSSFHIIEQLSLKNCQAIELGYDLMYLAKEYSLFLSKDIGNISCASYHDGFQKALSILGDKKFSEEDLKFAYNRGSYDDRLNNKKLFNADKYIQSLQQTEWDVEIVMEVVPDFYSRSDEDGSIFTSNKKEVPKLDADGCLILKRKI